MQPGIGDSITSPNSTTIHFVVRLMPKAGARTACGLRGTRYWLRVYEEVAVLSLHGYAGVKAYCTVCRSHMEKWNAKA